MSRPVDAVRGPWGIVSGSESDEELWAAVAVERSCPAFAELCRRHQHQLRALAWRITGSEELAHEVAQDVFLRLWEAPHRFRPERGQLRGFLLRDGHARAIDCVRAEVRMRTRTIGWAEAQESEIASAEELALDAQRDRRVRGLLDVLPVAQREALLLAFVDGQSYRAVATTLDLPEGTVKSRIRTGLQALRRSLGDGDGDTA